MSEQDRRAAVVLEFDFAETTELINTDSLNIWEVGDTGYTYVLNRKEWQGFKGLVAFCPPDTLVPTDREDFSFLSKDAKYHKDSSGKGNVDAGTPKYTRIKARRIRGYMSYGLLAKLPDDCGLNAGDDAREFLNLGWYEPDIASCTNSGGFGISGDIAQAPSGIYYKYDVDAYKKYAKKMFIEGEPCLVTVKLNGSCSRFVWKDGEIHVGSREQWKKEFTAPPKITLEQLTEDMRKRIRTPEDEATLEQRAKEVYDKKIINFKQQKNTWWSLLEYHPQIIDFCKTNEGYCLYGEMYGHVGGGFRYNVPQGQVRFAAFDILLPTGQWMDADQFLDVCAKYDVPTAPVIARDTPFSYDTFLAYAEGDNLLPGSTSIKEGAVVCPMRERYHPKYGRTKLKMISDAYLCR